ncbi:hypothetical protein [Hoyosella altamirensis]|uniref:MFS family permease n=1 Tax=Hoyosella altamirensis TaxID=616997 RepID=A0A839RL08_9ACTN|nr:hypothetical protein [Hoyosella altamirensis]MBB3037150.1 MFS family permease [Hoyosella altamirensis]
MDRTTSVGASVSARGHFARTWTLAFVGGELAGFVPPAIVGVALGTLGAHDVVFVVALTIAGIAEGAALGAAQAWVLRRFAPSIDWRRWVAVTASAAGFAWFIGMSTSQIGGASPLAPWLLVLLFVPLWLAALLAMGFAQWTVLRRVVPGSSRWIWVTAGAWLIGVSIPVIALSIVPDGWPLWSHGIVGVVAAVAMGLTVGALTGRTLASLLARQTRSLRMLVEPGRFGVREA